MPEILEDNFVAHERRSPNTRAGFDILGALRRQFMVIVLALVFALSMGILYILQAVPTYSSSVSILIDAKKVGITAASALEGSLTFEAGAIDSQLQILVSDKLASSVASKLGLQNDYSFIDPPLPYFRKIISRSVDRLFAAAGLSPTTSIRDLPESFRLISAANILQDNLQVSRVARSYVFNITYTARDPQLAQSIAGNFANAYLEDQLDSKYDSTRRATNWMEERIRDLRAQSLAADEAVQKYRADNNLVAASGRLLDEQSLTDATTQLTVARGALDAASARYQTLKKIVDEQDLNGGLTASISNPNVAQLRSKYLSAAKLESEISARYGASHLAAQKARQDMAEYTKLIFAELANTLPGYQSDVAIAQAQVNSIQITIDRLREMSTTNDTAMVKLRSLEQEALTLKSLYSTFLQKAQELQQQQSFPVTDARVISEASVPLRASSPRSALILLGAILGGAVLGAGLGTFREWRDRGFRTASQVREELGLEFIGNVPLVKLAKSGKSGDGADGQSNRTISKADPLLHAVADDPFSQFAEAIRALRYRTSLEFPKRRGVVIGLVSMFADEGKSTIAKNLASAFAIQGTKTLLVDGDLRNPSLSRSLIRGSKKGLAEVVACSCGFDEVIATEAETGLVFLSAGVKTRSATDLFGSGAAHDLLETLRGRFDVIVIDFPPIGSLTDAMAATSFVDGYFFVAQWGKTPRRLVKEFVLNHPRFCDQILGVVLNKVDLRMLERYGAYQGSSQYKNYSKKYFDAHLEEKT